MPDDILSTGQLADSPEEQRYHVADDEKFQHVLDFYFGPVEGFPDEFEGSGYPDVDCWQTNKWQNRYSLSKWAIEPEYLLALTESIMLEAADERRIQTSNVTPLAQRGSGFVPVFRSTPTTVLDYSIMPGYRYWIVGYSLGLFPSVSNELNYVWQILVDGQDILNKGENTVQLGRPVKNDSKVPIGYSKSNMILVKPGSRIQIIVTANSDLGASDTVTGCIFGMLEPIGE